MGIIEPFKGLCYNGVSYKVEKEAYDMKIKWISLIALCTAAVMLTGCGGKTLSKAEQAALDAKVAKEKHEMAEKKRLSDFQNKAYKIYKVDQLSGLKGQLQSAIGNFTTENAVKMVLSYELAMRMALQNDSHYGAVSGNLLAAIGDQKGIINLPQLSGSHPELKAEADSILDNGFAVFKDESGAFRVVDYNQLQVFKPYVNDEYNRYMTYMALETTQPSIRNKIVQIDSDQLWERLYILDTFFTDYPTPSDDLIRNNLGRSYQEVMKHFIYGDEQRRNFDPMTGKLDAAIFAKWQAWHFNSNSRMYLPFENFKAQLITDQGILTPAVSTHIQEILRLCNEMVTDHID